MNMREPHSINDIRTAIRELSSRAELARKEGRPADADEIEQRRAGLPRRTQRPPDRLAVRRN